MFLALLRKEIVSHVLTLRFGVTFILFLLLVFASAYVTTNEYRRDLDEALAANRAAQADLRRAYEQGRDTGDNFYTVFYRQGRKESLPPPPLSSLVQGLRPGTPAMVQARAWSSEMIGRGGEQNPLAGLLPIPDLVYVVGVVLSLLAILFAFDAVSGEKEAGTLRLMLSNAVPRDQVLLAKWVGGYLVLVAPFLIAVFGGVLYAWWKGALTLTGESLPRLLVILLIACLYISVFFTLSLAVSALTHRSATALFLCLLIWVVWILVIPNLAPVVAKILRPGYSPRKVDQEKAAVRSEIRLRMERLTLTTGKLSYGTEIQEARDKLEREEERRLQQWDRFLEDSIRRQRNLTAVLGRLSPAACWTYAAVALADVGPGSFRRLEEAFRKLRAEMEQVAESIRPSRDQPVRSFKLDQVPSLRVAPASFRDAAGEALNDILILAILNAVFFMTAFVRFLRYDVR